MLRYSLRQIAITTCFQCKGDEGNHRGSLTMPILSQALTMVLYIGTMKTQGTEIIGVELSLTVTLGPILRLSTAAGW